MNAFLTVIELPLATPSGLLLNYLPLHMPLLAQSFAPLPVVVGIAAAAVVVFGVVWLLHAYTLSAARKELSAYKDQVVALSDKIDALKERHKLLPYMDHNFSTPMSGETLSVYNDVAQRLIQHRQTWLKLMDVWEQAQKLLESESIFGSGRSRAARRSLRDADAPAALAALVGNCEEPLNRIEQAHEQAATELTSYQQADQQLGSQLDAVRAAALSLTPYQTDRSSAATLVEQAQGLLPADPLASLRCLGAARGKIVELGRLAAKMLEHVGASRDLLKKLADAQQMASQRRALGFFLREEGANPDPLLAESQQQHALVADALNRADETVAATLLAKGFALIEQARQGIERHVAAKTRCDTEIPVRQEEARRLADALALARGQQAELSRDFAADSWFGVADNAQRVETMLAAADRLLGGAVRSAAADHQLFLQASKQLDQATENHKHAETELTAVGKRLHELIELRAACQAQIHQLRTRADQVNHLLLTNTADRLLANERYRMARSAFEHLVEDSRMQRPDWTRLTTRVKEIQADLERVEKLGKEDIQLSQQAAAEIAETEQVIRNAKTFSDHGCSPDVAAAESQLAQARGSFAAQGYEETIRLANAAEQLARAAHQEAASRAQRRQQELESQRRAEAAAAIPAPLMQAEVEQI